MNTLSTNRLLIRPFDLADLDAAHQLLDHDLRWSGPGITVEQRRERLQREISLTQWADTDNLFGYRAIVLKPDQTLIGICGFLPALHAPEQQILFWTALFGQAEEPPKGFTTFELEIGYAIASQHQHQGYAAEACYALLEYAFGELKVRRIFAATNRNNVGSIGLMQRIGMRIAQNPERLDEEWPDAPGVLGVIENYLTQPTPYPEVNDVLHRLLTGARRVLADRFIGLYLYGSLASGDFSLETSDIDFLVVTTEALPADMVAALDRLHQQLNASGLKWATKLEGSYVPQAVLRRYDPAAPACPQINEGNFYLAQQGSDWIIQRHILREQGVVVAGASLQAMIDPVAPEALRGAVCGFLREWWGPMLENPARLQSSEYQAYAVLTMCRALQTLEQGTILSKPAAAYWAQQKFGEPWATVIGEALAWRVGKFFDHFETTLALIGYTVEQGRKIDHGQPFV
ncbi:MAG: GNAT family N-acetyltransferase [Caldilineaceae bacterium]